MASYHVWHATYVSAAPITLDAFVTHGSAFFLRDGTDALVRAALDAIGVLAAPTRWTFTPMRAAYFSSYRQPGAPWEDAWQLVWRLRVELAVSPPLPPAPGWGYVDLEAADASYRPDDRVEDRAAWPCLVLADAPDLAAIARMRTIVQRRWPEARVVLGQAFDRFPQLRCDLGERPRAFYEAGAVEAEALLVELAAAGAAVGYEASRDRA